MRGQTSLGGSDTMRLPRTGASTLLRLIVEKLPLVAVAAISTTIAILLLRHAGATNEAPDTGLGHRLVRVFTCYGLYLAKAVWPTRLAMPIPQPQGWSLAPALIGAAVVAAISAVAIALARRKPYLLVGWLWFLGMLVPVIGFVPVGSHPFADRYTYLPLIGLLIIAVWGLADVVAAARLGHTAPAVAACIVLLGCVVASRVQIGY